MTIDQIYSIIEEIAPYKSSITLNVANEPLIAEYFKYSIKRIKENGLSGTFNTNGLALNYEIAKILVDIEFDSINFSIDALSSRTLKKVRGYDNIEKINNKVMLMLKTRGKKSYPRIGVTFVKQNENIHELNEFIEFWKNKVDLIKINGYIEHDQPKLEKCEVPKRIPCRQIFRDMVIRSNGNVSPCVITTVNPDDIIGNIFKEGGINKVWNNAKFKKLRELHNQNRWNEINTCKTCQYWTESNKINEEEKDGFLIRYSSNFAIFYNVIDKIGNWNRNLYDRTGSYANEEHF